MCAIGIFSMQVVERTSAYFRYGTIVDVQHEYAEQIPFPAVTFCNQNNFR